MLREVAAVGHIEQLHAPADPENGNALVLCGREKLQFPRIPVRASGVSLGMRLVAVEACVHIRAAG